MRYQGMVYRPPSEAYSLIVQVTYGCSHNRCAFCEMYDDKHFSMRPMQEIREDFELARRVYHRVERVFLADGDALMRRTEDLVEILGLVYGLFPECGVRFIAVLDHVDTCDPAGKKARQINGLINEWYLEDLSGNVRAVLDHKRHSGCYIASFALYGYRKDPADHSRLLPDPEAAAVVRHIYALYLQGYGTARIAHILNAEGIPPPSVYRQQHGGPAHTGSGQWSRATLHQMLTNRTYAGDLEQGRRRKVSYKSARSVWLPRSQWIVVPGTHEGLVSRADFAAVQARLARRGRGAL